MGRQAKGHTDAGPFAARCQQTDAGISSRMRGHLPTHVVPCQAAPKLFAKAVAGYSVSRQLSR